jgi:hypothetical protein
MSAADEPQTPAERVARLFTRSDGSFRFARWGRPIAPAIFGTDEAGERLMTEGLRAAAGMTGLGLAERDGDLGANMLIFLVRDWPELAEIPSLDRLIPDLAKLVSTLGATGANQYRIFDFDETGAIRICITLIRLDAEMERTPGRALALGQAVMGLLLWSDHAFLGESPVALMEDGRAVIRSFHADLIRAAYDPALPPASTDPATAESLAARIAGPAA